MIVVPVRCPHAPTACKMASLIRVVKSEHDSIGGTVLGHISSMPIGLGEPCFDKLEVSNRSAETSYHACVLQCNCVQMMRQMDAENASLSLLRVLRDCSHLTAACGLLTRQSLRTRCCRCRRPRRSSLARALPAQGSAAPRTTTPSFRLNLGAARCSSTPVLVLLACLLLAVTGVVTRVCVWIAWLQDGVIKLATKTNNAGGTLGGITNGADIYFRVAVKPVSTIGQVSTAVLSLAWLVLD